MNEINRKKKWFWLILLFSALGLGVSAYLTYVHFKVAGGDESFASFCNINEEFNCDAVAASEWSMLFGIPVAVWGLLFYLFYFVSSATRVLLGRLKNLSIYYIWLSVVSMGGVVFLATISKVVIQTWCILCVASWVINLFLLLLSVLSCHIPFSMHPSYVWQGIKWLFGAPWRTGLVVVLVIIFTTTVGFAWNKELKRLDVIKKTAPRFEALSQPVTLTGEFFGSRAPELTIVEFSDFQCPHCSHLHKLLKQLVKDFPNVKFIHKDYPLDQACLPNLPRPFHKSACKAALFARCANRQDKYWQAVELLFERQKALNDDATFEEMIGTLELDVNQISTCLEDAKEKQALAADIQEGVANKFTGTPVIVFAGTHRLASPWADGKLKAIIKKWLKGSYH